MEMTIAQTIDKFLEMMQMARSENTARSYRNALNAFALVLEKKGLSPEETPLSELREEAVSWFLTSLKGFAPATEQLYLAAVVSLYKYLVAENLSQINLPRIQMMISMRARRPGQRLPLFPRDDIEKVLEYARSLNTTVTETENEYLQNLRDRAFLHILADTGLRVHEACNLRRGDLDWNEGKAIMIGKGNRQDVVRFSQRALKFLKDYLTERAKLDGGSGRSLGSLPLFTRHDKGAGKKVKGMTTTTGRNIVRRRVREVLGGEAEGTITPHSFRHYFVTTVLLASQGNLKLAQELARHRNISTTTRYAHLADDELDRGYFEVFEAKD